MDNAKIETIHPLIGTHPETWPQVTFYKWYCHPPSAGYDVRREPTNASFSQNHSTRLENTCLLRWRKGSIAFWNNRCTQHRALNGYHGHSRVMHRVTIAGERTA